MSANPGVLELRRNHELGRPKRTWPTVSVPLPSQSPTTGEPLSPYAKLRSAGPEELELRSSQVLRLLGLFRSAGMNSPGVSTPSPSQSPESTNPSLDCASAGPAATPARKTPIVSVTAVATRD